VTEEDPLAIREVELLIPLVKGAQLYPIGFADPTKIKDKKHLDRVEEVLKLTKVKALKVFLGYLHFFPSHYGPYFRLAAEYDIPVIFHTGDPYAPKAKIKYADPIWIDEVAVDFPETKFVLAHFGNPWCDTGAEVVWKNENVWADLAGLWIGSAEKFEKEFNSGVLDSQVARFRHWIEYAEKPNRFLFGTDWPLANLAAYRDFVRRMFPEDEYKAVFRDNAKALFKI
jgi:predicted TIM-barrel fold metal-dependent hydrolase